MAYDMSIKEFLNQAFELDHFIKAKQEELDELRERAKSVPTANYSRERVQGGERSDRVANTAAAIVDLERVITADIDEYFRMKQDIYNVIESVETPRLKLILQLRYANFKKWDEIQEIIEITDLRYIFRLHNDALKEAEKNRPA